MRLIAVLTIPALYYLPKTLAWGPVGHETVAYIAQNFVLPETRAFGQRILADTSDSYLANVATWADSYRETSVGKFSARYHFIDAQDNPPQSCNVDYIRDCGAIGCVIRAISNYTTRLQDPSLPAPEIENALKFIIHLIGDIHQPLHVERLRNGGNTIGVSFNNVCTNLHFVWDNSIIEIYAGGNTLMTAKSLATKLSSALHGGAYKSKRSRWLDDIDIENAIGTATAWARDANSYVCSVVLPGGIGSVENKDLGPSGPYYRNAYPTINELLARAGYRLAAWLNLVAARSAVDHSEPKEHGKGMNILDDWSYILENSTWFME